MQPPEFWTALDRPLQEAIYSAIKRGLSSLRAPPPMTLDEWAEKFFYLSGESSQGQKRWTSFPYQRAILCMMGDDHIEEVDLRKSARVGYSKMLLASIGYDAHHKRRNQCLWQPTDDDSDEFCKTEIEPMLRDVKALQEVFPDFMRKNKANTLNLKKFLYSLLYMKGGKSAGNFRRMTLQAAKIDEFDGFDQKVEGSADPFTLAWKRLEGATFPKMICGSTPRLKGLSHIEKRELAADVRMNFRIICPHCGVEHPLMWGGKNLAHGFKWDREDPESVRHHCPHCHEPIVQAEYLKAAETGVWVSDCGNYRCESKPYLWTDGEGTPLVKPPRHVAVHIWTAYSPQTTWAGIIREFLNAMRAKEGGDSAPLEGFINETLGETWEDEADKTEVGELLRRAEDYPLRTVPNGGLEVVAGVDTQDDRWEVAVYAIGRDEEAWCIDYAVIHGNPADENDWNNNLLPYLKAPFTHVNGAEMAIAASAVDTGGHFTHQAYNFCRQNVSSRIYATQGDAKPNMPIKGRSSLQDVNYRGRILKKGVKLWKVGTDTAKDLLFSRFKIVAPDPGQARRGYVHFSKHLPPEFFRGITSEVRRIIRTSKGDVSRWMKKTAGIRNEPLDCTVYSMFASHMLDHHKLSEAQWLRLESALLALMPEKPVKTAPLGFGEVEVREPVKSKKPNSRIGPPSSTNSNFASDEWLSRMKR